MPVSRLSILRHWLLPPTTSTKKKPVVARYPLFIGLRSCPYSEALSADLRRQIFSRNVNLPIREFWVSSRQDPLFSTLKKEYKHPTYPILVATRTLPPVHEPPHHSRDDIKMGGSSDFNELLSKMETS